MARGCVGCLVPVLFGPVSLLRVLFRKSREDPVFGTLTSTFPEIWEGKTFSRLFGREIVVYVDAGDAGPDEAQRAVFTRFRDKETDLRDALQQAVFAYYGEVYPTYREDLGHFVTVRERLEMLPRPSTAVRIWKLLEPTGLCIPNPAHDPQHERFSLQFETTWDQEHGLEVWFRDWDIEQVDVQGRGF
jgi:hypothetical protein